MTITPVRGHQGSRNGPRSPPTSSATPPPHKQQRTAEREEAGVTADDWAAPGLAWDPLTGTPSANGTRGCAADGSDTTAEIAGQLHAVTLGLAEVEAQVGKVETWVTQMWEHGSMN